MTKREQYEVALQTAKEDLKTAGPIHRKDLIRQIHRMQKELMTYDRYQRQARIARERATASEGPTV